MRMDNGHHAPDSSFSLPLSMALGADQRAISILVGAVSSVIEHHKMDASESSLFRIADLNIGDGSVSACVVDAFRQQCGKEAHIRVSGTEIDPSSLEKARDVLSLRDALGILDIMDASSSPAKALRNKLECVGGADMVVYAHAAYPGKLPEFKLQRMVDRLGDMLAPNGAVITLHNHGPSDVEDIRRHVFGLRASSSAGVNCDTQHRLEQAFGNVKLHSFSVTVPNMVSLPANMRAIEIIFSGEEKELRGKNAEDASAIRSTLEKLAGGKSTFDKSIRSMDSEARKNASLFFAERIRQAGGNDLPVTVGGGQMVMAFRSQDLAQEAFRKINMSGQSMTPPAIALPISSSVMPEFDKHDMHKKWKRRLAEHGIINPPRVCQAELDVRTHRPESRPDNLRRRRERDMGHHYPAPSHHWPAEHRPIGN